MNTQNLSPSSLRRRKERLWVISVLALIVAFGLLEGWFFRFQPDLPLFSNILLFTLINVNVILLLLLAYLVFRNIVKLVFERKRNILGHKLRTHLVIAFVGLSLIPTLPMFWLATTFIFSSLDYWFSHRVEQSLEQSVTLAKDYLKENREGLGLDCKLVEEELNGFPERMRGMPEEAKEFLHSLLERHRLDAILIWSSVGDLLWEIRSSRFPHTGAGRIHDYLPRKAYQVDVVDLNGQQEVLLMHSPLPLSHTPLNESTGQLAIFRLLPTHISEQLDSISSGYEDYLQLKLLQSPLKTSHFITFSIVTLLVVFAAIWFGFFLAKGITVPIQALVSATQHVADGNLDVQLDMERNDEIGMLITSFNKMVHDLRESREQLANAYSALQLSHTELEDRRRYMEIVLTNIGAGVISLDSEGRVMTMNKSAEATFGLRAENVVGKFYAELLQPVHFEIVKSFVDAYRMSRQPYIEQQTQVIIGNRSMVLLVKASILRDDQDQYMGVVVVLDDLTELEKAQRMAAWREVARRIAHEIKNPLTPIQLSAQRLRRKYFDLLEKEESVFDECTRTIIQQVDRMQHLVNEFSKFARLPRARLAPCDLPAVVESSLSLYRHTYPGVELVLETNGEFPSLMLDHDQFKQVLINLVENAIHALGNRHGVITVRLFYDPILKIARIECADTGHGLSAEDKLHMFEPYYSTKEKGTGLGLAIVSSIVSDHNGFVRVRDNIPQGTVIIIELPG